MTVVLKYTKKHEGAICRIAARLLQQGKIIVYPTDTIYGLGCDAQNKKAVGEIYRLKKRPSSMPLSVLVSDFRMLEKFAKLNAEEKRFSESKLPGKFTLIFSPKKKLPVSKSRVGFRIPKHWCVKIAKEFGWPITTTSANLHGQETPASVSDLKKIFGKKVSLYIDGGVLRGRASKVVDISENKILRK